MIKRKVYNCWVWEECDICDHKVYYFFYAQLDEECIEPFAYAVYYTYKRKGWIRRKPMELGLFDVLKIPSYIKEMHEYSMCAQPLYTNIKIVVSNTGTKILNQEFKTWLEFPINRRS